MFFLSESWYIFQFYTTTLLYHIYPLYVDTYLCTILVIKVDLYDSKKKVILGIYPVLYDLVIPNLAYGCI